MNITSIEGLALWLDASNIDGLNNSTLSDGDAIPVWNDLSGNENHGSQSDADSQPIVLATDLNGLDVVSFDGTNDYLQSALTNSFIDDGFSIFAVMKWDQPGGAKGYMLSKSDMGANNGYTTFFLDDANGASNKIRVLSPSSGGIALFDNWSEDHSRYNLVHFKRSPSELKGYSNGSLEYTKSRGAIYNSSAGWTLGRYNNSNLLYGDGKFAELIIIEGDVSTEIEYAINGYLSDKWGLTETVDSDADGIMDANDSDTPVGSGSSSSDSTTDSDNDGITDAIEIANNMNPFNGTDASLDNDGDGLTNAQELAKGTNINSADSDGDGIDDLNELALGTNPTNGDSDNDGQSDGAEVLAGTNPTDNTSTFNDKDEDGLSDEYEDSVGMDKFNPNDANEDLDGDGINNKDEAEAGLNPNNSDSDNDGIEDGVELANNLDPTNGSDGLADTDNDGLTNAEEIALGTSITSADSDGDGISDAIEVADGTNPKIPIPMAMAKAMVKKVAGTNANDAAAILWTAITMA